MLFLDNGVFLVDY